MEYLTSRADADRIPLLYLLQLHLYETVVAVRFQQPPILNTGCVCVCVCRKHQTRQPDMDQKIRFCCCELGTLGLADLTAGLSLGS